MKIRYALSFMKSVGLVALVFLALHTGASVGDRSPAFARCHSECMTEHAAPASLLYSASDNCHYACAAALTDRAIGREATYLDTFPGGQLEGLPLGQVVQFNGKWPFTRIGVFTEPLSVAFSLLNLAAHVISYRTFTPRPSAPIRVYYAVGGIATWLASAVFHTKDTPQTEKLDYFSAAAGILVGFYLAYSVVIRRGTRVCAVLCTAAWITHCTYLTLRHRFNYGYNMQASITVGVLQALIWIYYACFSFAPYRTQVLLPLSLVWLTTVFEVFDFPPIGFCGLRLLDAHALWHLSTAPVVILWYRFLGEVERGSRGEGGGGGSAKLKQ